MVLRRHWCATTASEKHPAGMGRLPSSHSAHFQSSNSDCVVHSAGGSLRVGAENPVANLGKSTMRPLD